MPTTTKLSIAAQREAMTGSTRAIYDFLSDGRPHTYNEVIRAGVGGAIAEDFFDCVKQGDAVGAVGSEHDRAIIGAEGISRAVVLSALHGRKFARTGKGGGAIMVMPGAAAREWARAITAANVRRPREAVVVPAFGETNVFGGMSEWVGWSYAPLTAREYAYVNFTVVVHLEVVAIAFPGWNVTMSPEGLVMVSAPVGVPVKEAVSAWAKKNGYTNEGVRGSKDPVSRRDLRQLPPRFYAAIIEWATNFAKGSGRKHNASQLNKMFRSEEDIDSFLNMTVLELAQSFDASKGAPFGTWVTLKLRPKIQDHARQVAGRTATDLQNKHAATATALQKELSRTPSNEELRLALGLTREEMSIQRVSLDNLGGLTDTTSLDDGVHDSSPALMDERSRLALEETEEDEQRKLLTLAFLAATNGAANPNDAPLLKNAAGFLVTYLMMWDDWVKGDLAKLGLLKEKDLTLALEETHERLRDELKSLNFPDFRVNL